MESQVVDNLRAKISVTLFFNPEYDARREFFKNKQK